MNHLWLATEIIGGLVLASVGVNLWQYHTRSQALVSPKFLPRHRPAPLTFPCGLCRDCHGIFQGVGPFIERCNGCGEIRELVNDTWVYHFARLESQRIQEDAGVE